MPDAAAHTPPDVAEVDHIVGLENRVIRNLRITQCYAELSAAMAARIGPAVYWVTFATWASRQAGCTIRGEDLLDKLERRARLPLEFLHPIRSFWRVLLRRGLFQPDTRLGRIVRVVHSPFDAFERTSETVMAGNLKVFEEIGRLFALYLRDCPAEAGVDSVPFQQFLALLRPGDSPDGQDHLRRAFTCYQRMSTEPADGLRAQLLLQANAEIGMHEQTRLQPEIRDALDAGSITAEDLGARVLSILFPGWRNWWMIFREPLRLALGSLASAFRRFSHGVTRAVVTDRLMVLSLPGGRTLDLSEHIADPYPESLQTLDQPELAALAARFEPPAGMPDDCGADDWSDFPERMHYILHVFRTFQEHLELLELPFTSDQVRTMKQGRLPEGRL